MHEETGAIVAAWALAGTTAGTSTFSGTLRDARGRLATPDRVGHHAHAFAQRIRQKRIGVVVQSVERSVERRHGASEAGIVVLGLR